VIPPLPDRATAGRALLAVLGAALLAAAAVFLMRQSGVAMPYPLALGVLLVALALRGLVAHAVAPRVDLTAAPPPRPTPGAAEGGFEWSGVELIGSPMTRWEPRLDSADGVPERFAATVRPALAAVVDERLRLRHGCTIASDPVRARRLLGEPLWLLLTGEQPPERTPTPGELAALLAAAESL